MLPSYQPGFQRGRSLTTESQLCPTDRSSRWAPPASNVLAHRADTRQSVTCSKRQDVRRTGAAVGFVLLAVRGWLKKSYVTKWVRLVFCVAERGFGWWCPFLGLGSFGNPAPTPHPEASELTPPSRFANLLLMCFADA